MAHGGWSSSTATSPKLILAMVVNPGDVTPAWPGTGPHAMAEATAWVRNQLDCPDTTLMPLTRPGVWRVDENPQEGR